MDAPNAAEPFDPYRPLKRRRGVWRNGRQFPVAVVEQVLARRRFAIEDFVIDGCVCLFAKNSLAQPRASKTRKPGRRPPRPDVAPRFWVSRPAGESAGKEQIRVPECFRPA